MKHKIVPALRKITKNKKYVSIFGLAFVMVATLGVGTIIKNNLNYPSAELRFAEMSKNPNIVGSVTPASCSSYPTWGDPHALGDTGGFCIGTCPAPQYPSPVSMKACQYYGGGDSGLQYTYVTPTANTCPASYQGLPWSFTATDMGVAYTCKQTCWDGSSVTPFLGQSCPPQPAATVQVWFP